MNAQVRKLFAVVLLMFVILGVASTVIQFFNAPSLMADDRNSRKILQATERDRGPIIVAGDPIAFSQRLEPGSNRFQRIYPEADLYAPITGYFSAVNLTATGMERATNDVLEGATSDLFWQRMRNLFAGRARQGGGVELTIDPALQQEAARLLGDRRGAVVIEEAKTGRILALYSSPSFDPNPLAAFDSAKVEKTYEQLNADPGRPLVNRAIGGDRYAPGSVFKILTAAAMVESGIKADTLLDSPVSMTLPGTEVSLSNIESSSCGSGKVTLTEAFARSCNTTFALASEDLPAGKLGQVAQDFGFGESFTVPLSVTASSFPEKTDAAQLAMSSIGQFEVAVTPMHMAMITQAVANGGTMLQPYLVDKVLDADNQTLSTASPKTLSQPITPEIAESLTTMMKAVVDEPYGTGTSMSLSGVSVAAKTGTAEVGDGSRANAWAVAFAPADDPTLVVSVVIEGDDSDPTPHGGTVAGPIVHSLLKMGLQ